ncbi:FecR domain-containing protein [Rhodospirillaceae bacterium SYSU D60014]|uniref:FecR family protein n=1 Tax=Virgifigura deserti TaxID=2268457 RepID=UPI000E66B91B
MRRRLGSLGLLLAGAALAQDASAQEVEVGVTAAVNPTTKGFSQTFGQRTLVIGYDIVFGERITTTDRGQAQILFIDESSLTVGPNSDLVIDAFLFDPEAGSGELAGSLAKGVFRYVGGRISKTNPVELRTPTAVLSIRGGVALFRVDGAGTTTAIFIYGEELLVASAAGGDARLQRPGYKVTVRPDGALTAIEPASPEEIAAILDGLEGTEGESGGAGETPTDARVARTAIVTIGSGVQPGTIDDPSRRSLAVTERLADPATAEIADPAATDDAVQATEASQSFDLTDIDAIGGGSGGVSVDFDAIGAQFGLANLDPLPLPAAGTATLTGFAIGTVEDGGTLRVADGDFSLTADFASRTGDLSITDFDGRAFGGTVSESGTHHRLVGMFSGTLTEMDQNGPLNGTADGVLVRFTNPDPITATVGNFSVTDGKSYTVDGGFIGTDDGSIIKP